jgi:hypothetical protein
MGGIYFRYNRHDHDVIDSILGKERRHREVQIFQRKRNKRRKKKIEKGGVKEIETKREICQNQDGSGK